jgi:1,4-alpha-glucan branching enzyme
MKFTLLPLLFLTFLASGCAEKHYSKLNENTVTFYYKAPEAHEVLFASSHDNYKLLAARKIKNHLWEVSVPAERGFTYFYVVDGIITIPACPFTENDDFGSRNCLYIAEM